MASLQHIQKRLRGIQGIHQMTAAMELVAATKMRRAQETALASRPYAATALEILANLTEGLQHLNDQSFRKHPLITRRPVEKTCIILVAADKGLAGSFNSAVVKRLEEHLAAQATPIEKTIFVGIGQKACDYLARKKYPLRAQFTKYGDLFAYDRIEPLARLVQDGYTAREWDSVLIFSTHFVSALKQTVLTRQLLPIEVEKIRAAVEEIIPETGRFANLRAQILEHRPLKPVDYLIEPTRSRALDALLPALVTMQIYHLILEANASEHSARRMAMKNATDNAGELIDALLLEFNRSRQAAITKEIIEVTSTSSALK